jgi:hypothetical protein
LMDFRNSAQASSCRSLVLSVSFAGSFAIGGEGCCCPGAAEWWLLDRLGRNPPGTSRDNDRLTGSCCSIGAELV